MKNRKTLETLSVVPTIPRFRKLQKWRLYLGFDTTLAMKVTTKSRALTDFAFSPGHVYNRTFQPYFLFLLSFFLNSLVNQVPTITDPHWNRERFLKTGNVSVSERDFPIWNLWFCSFLIPVVMSQKALPLSGYGSRLRITECKWGFWALLLICVTLTWSFCLSAFPPMFCLCRLNSSWQCQPVIRFCTIPCIKVTSK